ncbi:hypothetical protein [Mycobacteroides abscessus]|uniref:hypothetical protein n=1 Tax=Mycobacteroides abscessus TaxID=36809 RepID=UPI000927026E|nr:hypothetical protein [Mycobacteroides abscessus]SKS27818.1 Uncharacterised protein [Mycobacteroides abscessus subsp. abscessus]SHU54930.1 Uncharacterised protein [Mycobacteroides abscessus subsp. bolletii]SHW63520.1 Uncharacterised protein [Mycobacteroides abscessus subsp. bolletii]SHW91573.1 Uncharacterised protein [Mycobacteroides abscessus subsp. bolletii]SHX33542.1 Uncharacterised protein [Mycobacteroides abscessus subsp. bolletii]
MSSDLGLDPDQMASFDQDYAQAAEQSTGLLDAVRQDFADGREPQHVWGVLVADLFRGISKGEYCGTAVLYALCYLAVQLAQTDPEQVPGGVGELPPL